MRLSELKTGDKGIIIKTYGHGGFRKRIMEMGFVRGQEIQVLHNAPLKDPIKYSIMGYEVSLRRSEAAMVEVITRGEAEKQLASEKTPPSSITAEKIESIIDKSRKKITVALVGNPNSGKTSLFNHASGSHEHVGNYGGVTVDAKHGKMRYGSYEIEIYDLPGTYALTAYTPEEVFVRRHITDKSPDVIINVVAASNLERNLFLTTELIDMNLPMVVALNMYDELEASGARLDYQHLGEMLGVPMLPVVSRSGKGLNELFDTVVRVFEGNEPTVRNIDITYSPVLEEAIDALVKPLSQDFNMASYYTPRYLAVKFLEKDPDIERFLSARPAYSEWSRLRDTEVERIEKNLGEDAESAVTNEKYGFVAGALLETYTPGDKEQQKITDAIDSLVTHKFFGFPIFFMFMWLMFWATFKIGSYPMGWIESGVSLLGGWLAGIMSDGPLKDLIVDGVIGGVGGVIVFLPNILILYLFISFMEDSGYMARAAFIMDKVMHTIGLHGKSFIPLVMGFGCNVPAIMSARTIESRSSRLITILINPFMSCSARLPVFLLIAGTFFPGNAGSILFLLYLLGILVAIVTAKLLRKFMFRKDDTPFVMELPPYRMPTFRNSLLHMWDKAAMYLRKMGGLILVASICVWFLSYFPRPDSDTGQPRASHIEQAGHFIEPAMRPLGFDWRASVALLSGAVAKEVTVSTLGVLYAGSGETSMQGAPLSEKLMEINPDTGKPGFTTASALAFLVFVLLYFPCLASLVAIKQEAGGWKWAAFSFFFNTLIAWVFAFVIYNIANVFL